jgi:hypothetical protein
MRGGLAPHHKTNTLRTHLKAFSVWRVTLDRHLAREPVLTCKPIGIIAAAVGIRANRVSIADMGCVYRPTVL